MEIFGCDEVIYESGLVCEEFYFIDIEFDVVLFEAFEYCGKVAVMVVFCFYVSGFIVRN